MRSHLILATLAMLAANVAADGQEQPWNSDFWVSHEGNDANQGTAEKPFATLAQARDAVRRQIAGGLSKDMVVTIRGGTYELSETLVFGLEDSGTQEHSVTYRAQPGEKVVLSGGRRVAGWQTGAGKVWKARAPGTKQAGWTSRNFYVNGRRATRARTPNAECRMSMTFSPCHEVPWSWRSRVWCPAC